MKQGITGRAVVLALLLSWLAGYWVRQSEIIALACQGTEAVPSIPGLAALVVLLAVNALLVKQRRVRPLRAAEIITVFLFVTVATTMCGCGIGRFLIACLSSPYYYSTSAQPLVELAQYIPSWMSPTDPTIHRWLYESSPTGLVPLAAWRLPILTWTGFFSLFGGALFCLMALFSRPWIEEERLVFPLVRLPLQMIDPGNLAKPLFRERATWIGMLLALLLNVYNIIRGVFFGGPSGGWRADLARQITGAPWDALKPLEFHLRPELVGLGYLISTELSFSIWFFHLFNKLVNVFCASVGYRVSGVPFTQEQGIGAYMVLAAILFWKARRTLLGIFDDLPLTSEERRVRRAERKWALIGACAGLVGVLWILDAAGMAPWLAATYLAILTGVAVVYGRLRAEIGVPLVWAFPYGLQHRVIRYFLNSSVWVGPGPQYKSATIFALTVFLSRGYFPTVSGYGIEGIALGQTHGIRKSQMVALLLSAVAWGALISFYFHLIPYYAKGAVGLRGGIWGAGPGEYGNLYKAIQMPQAPDVPRIIATLAGGGFLAALSALRTTLFNSPFHPLGYAVSCAFGNILWGPFLIVWVVKTVLLRYGGHQAYLNALPGFLGFALGHFLVAGVIWGSLGAALGGPFLRYGVWFG